MRVSKSRKTNLDDDVRKILGGFSRPFNEVTVWIEVEILAETHGITKTNCYKWSLSEMQTHCESFQPVKDFLNSIE